MLSVVLFIDAIMSNQRAKNVLHTLGVGQVPGLPNLVP